MIIYLVGFMGCGKSTIGKELAAILNLKFIDSDEYLENKINKSISEIFSSKGEKYFRMKEKEILFEISKMNNVVISLGGGTPCFNNNMKIINNTGTSIYLEVDALNIINRLKNDSNQRPLIQNIQGNDLDQFIRNKLDERKVFYNLAQHRIDANLSISDVTKNLYNIITKKHV